MRTVTPSNIVFYTRTHFASPHKQSDSFFSGLRKPPPKSINRKLPILSPVFCTRFRKYKVPSTHMYSITLSVNMFLFDLDTDACISFEDTKMIEK